MRGDATGVTPARPTRPSRRVVEAQASWIACTVLFLCTVYVVLDIDVLWSVFGVAALTFYMLPIVSNRDPFRALPWEMTLLLSSPIILHISEGSRALDENIGWWDDLTSLSFAFSFATIGFLLTLMLDMYTEVKMNRAFAVFFVVIFTMAVSGFWQVGEYLSDVFVDTENISSNTQVMKEFIWVTAGGLVMGFVYGAYIKAMPKSRREVLGLIHFWEVPGWRRG
ncbi:MAG: hypothetical protein QG582_966 [Candidatus Thermoplasmatota archaeon]|nr:hypothetical protein [Candidatus Thermoplasmatota archaeon]